MPGDHGERVAVLEVSLQNVTREMHELAKAVRDQTVQYASLQAITDRNNREFPEIKKDVKALHERIDEMERGRDRDKAWTNGALWVGGIAVTIASTLGSVLLKSVFGG